MDKQDPKPWVWGEYRYTNEQRAACPSVHFDYRPRTIAPDGHAIDEWLL